SENQAEGVFHCEPRRRKRRGLIQHELQGFVDFEHQTFVARKARSMSWPCSVRKLSGWNCTPNSGHFSWRIAMISREPSGAAAQADTMKSLRSVSGRIT